MKTEYISFAKNFAKIIFRGVIMGLVALAVFLGWVFAVTQAQSNSGGKFWEILNKILASGNWQTDTTGTVKNAEKLGWLEAKNYQKISSPNQSCPVNQCVTGFKENGDIICK